MVDSIIQFCCLSFVAFQFMLLAPPTFYTRLNTFIIQFSSPVNILLQKISTLSNAQISHLSSIENIIQGRRKGEKILVKLTETYSNKFAESLPFEVANQAAATAAEVAVVDCNYGNKENQEACSGCDVTSEYDYNFKL